MLGGLPQSGQPSRRFLDLGGMDMARRYGEPRLGPQGDRSSNPRGQGVEPFGVGVDPRDDRWRRMKAPPARSSSTHRPPQQRPPRRAAQVGLKKPGQQGPPPPARRAARMAIGWTYV